MTSFLRESGTLYLIAETRGDDAPVGGRGADGAVPAGARAAALRELTGDPRAALAGEVDQLAPADMKAVTDLGIQVHSSIIH